jgi:hypothetical protein
MTPLKLLGLGTVLLAVLSAGTVSHAQDWPNRPVKVVVPFAATGWGASPPRSCRRPSNSSSTSRTGSGAAASSAPSRSRARTPTATP